MVIADLVRTSYCGPAGNAPSAAGFPPQVAPGRAAKRRVRREPHAKSFRFGGMNDEAAALARPDRAATDTGDERSIPMSAQATAEALSGRRERQAVAPNPAKPAIAAETEPKRWPGWGRVLLNVYNET